MVPSSSGLDDSVVRSRYLRAMSMRINAAAAAIKARISGTALKVSLSINAMNRERFTCFSSPTDSYVQYKRSPRPLCVKLCCDV